MKMIYNGTPIKSLNVKHYEMNTNDSNLQPSDMQAGIVAYGRGKRIVGTGKCFEFANYGHFKTNLSMYVPSEINVVEVASVEYPIMSSISFNNIGDIDFSKEQVVGYVNIGGSNFEIVAKLEGNMLTFICSNTIYLEVFYGRDNYL